MPTGVLFSLPKPIPTAVFEFPGIAAVPILPQSSRLPIKQPPPNHATALRMSQSILATQAKGKRVIAAFPSGSRRSNPAGFRWSREPQRPRKTADKTKTPTVKSAGKNVGKSAKMQPARRSLQLARSSSELAESSARTQPQPPCAAQAPPHPPLPAARTKMCPAASKATAAHRGGG
jgi:hypothetical protein